MAVSRVWLSLWMPMRTWHSTSSVSYVNSFAGMYTLMPAQAGKWGSILAVSFLLLYPVDVKAQEEFVKHEVSSTFSGAHAVQSHDLDGDGDADLIGAGLTVDAVAWWENLGGEPITWQEHIVAESFNGARFVDAADLDNDGDLDLFGAAASDDLIVWWENNGNTSGWTAHTVNEDFNFAIHLDAADLDADGDLDLIGAALKDDAIHWWESEKVDGVITWTEHVINGEFDGARHVCSIDMDGDGDLDLLGSAYIADDVKWWENVNGDATTWEGHYVDEEFDGVNVVIPVDIDNDNDIDLLGSADIADDVVIWLNMEGDGMTWGRIPIEENFDGAFSTIPADLDGDGDIDVLAAATNANQMTWWENTNGNGDSWNDHPIDESFVSPMTINVADVDGDGDLDVLGGNLDGEVVWWETRPETLPVELTSFDVLVDGGVISLHWETASELNNAGFEVQHKIGGDDFPQAWAAIAFVKGGGTQTEVQKYKRQFENLLPGTHRFRLKQIDFDGSVAYSDVVQVIMTTTAQTLSPLYPNPFNPEAKFSLTLTSAQEVHIEVYNMLGQQVSEIFTGWLDAEQVHEFNFEATDLPGGLYVISATGKNFTTTQSAMLVK